MTKLAGILAAIALAGCAGGTTVVGSEPVNVVYRSGNWTFNTSSGPVYVDFKYRIYDSGGMTALCMVGVGESSLIQADLFHLFFKEATLVVDGDDFGKGDFVRLVKPDRGGAPPQAQCARSELPWQLKYAGGRLTWRGGNVRIVS